MKLPCFNLILKNYKLCARLSIVSVFLLSSFLAIGQDANTASIANDVESILQVLNWSLKDSVSGSTGRIPEQLDDIFEYDQAAYKFLTGRTTPTSSLNYNDKNALPYLLGSLVYGLTGWAPNSNKPLDYSLHGDISDGNQTLLQLLALLHNISNVVAQSASILVVSNFVSVTNSGGGGVVSPDVLAANPWWSTNSAFVLSSANLGLEYPHDRTDNPGLFSFPEFLSAWSSRLQSPFSRPTVAQLRDSDSWWGLDAYLKQSSISEKITRNYTWFDWVADAMRSNRVVLSSIDSHISNSSDSQFFITNFVTVLNSITNQFDISVSNLVQVFNSVTNHVSLFADDILAGNPWWSTNSSFAAIWPIYLSGGASPYLYRDVRNPLTFPEAISFFLSSRTFDALLEPRFSLWTRWGENGQNFTEGRVFTFEDFLADYFKSNLVLTSVSSFSNLVSDASSTGATLSDEDDTVETNALDELTIHQADTSAIGDLTSVVDSIGIEDAFSGVHVSSANPVLRIFDGGQYGSVRVAPVDADFSLPQSVANLMKSISKWLWRLLCVVSIFCIVRQEFDFWSTLGGSASA